MKQKTNDLQRINWFLHILQLTSLNTPHLTEDKSTTKGLDTKHVVVSLCVWKLADYN